MSILIKGMEMPTSCWDCYFQDCGNCVLNRHKVVDKCILDDCRDEDCPLVELLPHGRLIDADELRERLHKMIVRFYSAYEKDGKDERIACLLEIDLGVRGVICDTSTIIEAEGEDNV